jgi:hypothetical protein
VRFVPVVLVGPAWERSGSLCGVLEGLRVGPFVESGLDEALGFAIGARRVRPGEAMFEPQLTAYPGEAVGLIARPVVGQDAPGRDAETFEPGRSLSQEVARRSLFLVRKSLVPTVNGAIALVSCPFALYEALSKRAGVADLKEKLDLRADQLLAKLVAGVEETLLPYWPRSITTLIIEPALAVQLTPGLSDTARDALTKYLNKCGFIALRLAAVRHLARKILRLDKALYWLISITATVSLIDLLLWAFWNDNTDSFLRTEVLVPGCLLAMSLIVAGIRQAYIQAAERQIIEE